jgi:hypothetical protein
VFNGPRGFGAEASSATDVAKQILPIATQLLKDDATYDVETLKARIRNHEKMAESLPEPLRTVYANKAKVLRAKLRAARDAQRKEAEDRASKWEWAAIGKSLGVTGIVVGGALVALLLAGVHKVSR